MRPEGCMEADGAATMLDHSLIIAVIGMVAETRPRIDGRDLAHLVLDACTDLPEGAMTACEIADLVLGMIPTDPNEDRSR